MKLHAQQTVAEAISVMNSKGLEALAVYEKDVVIGKLTYQELREFIDHEEKPGSIAGHKLHFNLATALPIIWNLRIAKYQQEQKIMARKKWINWFSAAAIVTLVMLGLAWLFFDPLSSQSEYQDFNVAVTDSNQVILTLENGEALALNSAETGIVVKSNRLYYTSGAAIAIPQGSTAYCLSVPKNSVYQVTLTDSTRIWLNASSCLQFPSAFDKNTDRKVSLSGEGYFEVAKLYNKARRVPFVVLTKGQEVDVLGTHFNVRAYPNEKEIKTTLLEGSVRVTPARQPAAGPDPTLVDPLYAMKNKSKTGVILKPNQQAVLAAQQVSIKTVNAVESIAWTKDDFTFRNTPLRDVLGVVAGWHNLKVKYDNSALGNILLGGELQKNESMANVLTTLELTANVRFKVQGKQVTVYKSSLIVYK